MKDLLILIAHLLTTIAKLLGPGGATATIADSLLMKQQLLISNRRRKRAPRLTPLDRFLLGFWLLFLIHSRIQQAVIIISPSTLLKFHLLLKKRKFDCITCLPKKTKTGPKGPSNETWVHRSMQHLYNTIQWGPIATDENRDNHDIQLAARD